MADVIRLKPGVSAESYTDDRGVSLRERIRALVSIFAAEWEKAGKKEAYEREANNKTEAYIITNGFTPLF